MQPRAGQAGGSGTLGRGLIALILALLLATCARERARRQEPPYQIGGPACLRALAARGIRIEAWPMAAGGTCGVSTPIRTAAGMTARFRPALETSCAMLVAWSDLESTMQEAAQTYLGSPVRTVRHYGSYSCRGVSGNAGRLSEHAAGRALDVSGFELADGRVVTIRDGWDGSRDERRFLRTVRDAACRRLGVILSPDSDRRHRDHLHLDLGGWRLCG